MKVLDLEIGSFFIGYLYFRKVKKKKLLFIFLEKKCNVMYGRESGEKRD